MPGRGTGCASLRIIPVDVFAFHLRWAGGAIRTQAIGAIEDLGLVGYRIVDRSWVNVDGEWVACGGKSSKKVVELSWLIYPCPHEWTSAAYHPCVGTKTSTCDMLRPDHHYSCLLLSVRQLRWCACFRSAFEACCDCPSKLAGLRLAVLLLVIAVSTFDPTAVGTRRRSNLYQCRVYVSQGAGTWRNTSSKRMSRHRPRAFFHLEWHLPASV